MSSLARTFPRQEILRGVLAVSILVVGITHFLKPIPYVRPVPPLFPHPIELVYSGGFFEISKEIGLVIPYVSVAAAWGMIALFIGVFPANINQAINAIPVEGIPHVPILYRIGLPFPAVLIARAWWYTREPERQAGAEWLKERLNLSNSLSQ